MKKLILSLVFLVNAFAYTVSGTGASFPYPVYKKWIKDYYNETKNKVNYTATGSGTGIKEVAKRHVDFGGTDKPLKPKTLQKAKLYQFPTVVGGIVFGYNLPGVDNLKLSEKAIEGIVLGDIKYWDDEIIKKDNPNVNLPHKKIIFVHRSDKSGTTFNFTYYLSKMSKTWREKYGARKLINWPTDNEGRGIAGKGNFGVSAAIKTNKYSIGYVDYADAKKNGLKMATIQARDKKFVAPTPENFAEGVKYAGFSKDNHFYKIIAYPKKGYPIIAATFILLPQEKIKKDKQVTAFFDYAFNKGDNAAKKLGYVPLPNSVKDEIRKYWEQKGISPQ